MQYEVLAAKARKHGLRPLIRDYVRSVELLRKKERRRTLLFGTCNHRLDWLLRAKRMEPSCEAAAGAAGAGSQWSAGS